MDKDRYGTAGLLGDITDWPQGTGPDDTVGFSRTEGNPVVRWTVEYGAAVARWLTRPCGLALVHNRHGFRISCRVMDGEITVADWRGVLTPAALAGAGGPPRGSPCYGRIGALKPGDRA